MDTEQDPFDLENLRLTPEKIAEIEGARAKLQPARQLQRAKTGIFVKLPYERILAAAGELQNAQLAVLVELAYQVFRTHNTEVLLTNRAFRSTGLSHDAKVRALRRLEAVGLIKVDW